MKALVFFLTLAGALSPGHAVAALATNLPPRVSISTPAHGSVFTTSAAIQITAEATDSDGTVERVEFFSGPTKIGESTSEPYTLGWLNVPSGTYWLTALATDDQGAISVSEPVEIAVIVGDCGPGLQSGQTTSNPTAPVLPSGLSPPASQVYFGQDVSSYPVFGANQVPRPSGLPNSDHAAAIFLARLPGVDTESFENFAPGSVPTQLTFGTNTVAVSGDQGIVEVADPASTINGEFPVSGAKGLELVGNIGSGFFALDFSTPQAAFGFYATDIELNGLNVTLVSADGTNRVFNVPVRVPQGTAGALFWGIIDTANPFVHVELTRTGSLEDGFLFDNLTIATPTQLLPEAVWPVASIADAAPVAEGTGGTIPVDFHITLSAPSRNTVNVEYFTLDGSAHSGSDYLQTNGVVTLLPGQTNATITIQILGDALPETNETIRVQIRNPSSALLDHCEAIGTILDDDQPKPPPELSISMTSPANHSVFCPGTEITLVAAVTSGSPVTKVEFYEGTTLLGVSTNAPFALVLDKSRVTPGDYALTARATDDQGNTARSASVIIAVSSTCGDVAIVRNFPDPEIDRIVDYLFEIGLSARVFDQEGLAFEMLAPYRTVIWDDLGAVDQGLTDNDVAVFQRVQTNGAALYLIGEKLASSTSNLSSATRPVWSDLVHLLPTTPIICDGTVQVQSTVDYNPILRGRFGTVEDFHVSSDPEAAQVTGPDAEVFGRCGGRDLLVGYPGFEVVDTGQPRVFSQNIRVVTGADADSIAQRKMLFQNVICWLHHCECSTFDVALEAESSQSELNVGDPLSYTINISHNGECEATGAVVTDLLPAGMTFVAAESQQGTCLFDPAQHTVICNLGHLAKSSTTPIVIVATAALGGTWTNWASVRINGETRTDNNSAEVIMVVNGSGPRLGIRSTSAGSLELALSGQEGHRYVVERSTDLRQWDGWRTNILGAAWSESFITEAPWLFFRARDP